MKQSSFYILFLLFISSHVCLHANIKIIYTAALIDTFFERRKQEYINSLNILSQFGYEPYIVENCKSGLTFFDDYSTRILYTQANNPNLRNKGVNEAQALIDALERFDFDDNDIIVKLTGRYYFKSDYFLRFIESHSDVDAFVKLTPTPDVFTGCFALRCKHLKDMLVQLDFEKMEQEMICVEMEVFEYLKRLEKSLDTFTILYLDKLDVGARIFGFHGRNNTVTQW